MSVFCKQDSIACLYYLLCISYTMDNPYIGIATICLIHYLLFYLKCHLNLQGLSYFLALVLFL